MKKETKLILFFLVKDLGNWIKHLIHNMEDVC